MAQTNPLRWKPRSLQQLILISFLLVVAPLCVLIFKATQTLTQQNDTLREYAQQALDTTARAQQMNQIAEDLLRASRQYQIVHQQKIAERLQQQAQAYRQELGVQSFWLNNNHQINEINTLLKQLLATPDDATSARSLFDATQQLDQALRQRLQHRLSLLNTESSKTRQQVWMMTVSLITLSALLILLMLGTINRPVQVLSARIRALGKGDRGPFNANHGPKELMALHEELNWLSGQLEALEQDKQRFLRHMSHELKTPLTSLREGSDLLAEGVTGPLNQDQQEVVTLLQAQSRALQALIEQLLDYNHLSQGVTLNLEQITVSALIADALAPFQLVLQQKNIRLELPDGLIHWPGDRHLMMRVLNNLISNATLYCAADSTLRINHEISQGLLTIDISNQGPLIPDAEVPRLFEPFFQGKNRRSGPIKGSGIGLSIAQDATQALNGQLCLHENSNNTVTFRFCLPRPE